MFQYCYQLLNLAEKKITEQSFIDIHARRLSSWQEAQN